MRHLFILLGIYAIGLGLTLFGAYIDTDVPQSSHFSLGMEIVCMSLIVFGLLVGIFYSLFFTFKGLQRILEQRFA
ncbi:hypothetical protein [Flavobacterium sp.]|jgi:hypothetical protein|uniref:hypothetical protein n=1 Tax=Flavobacterium sp. TaxID=239 RepID=UPI0022C4FD70|nr:hypothetical protein [Flavobacterium sp.]MCZ8143909.1 hypothetical protein [Flavobacterium sp.]MCZ8367287.1 hypothetical protein [Flavobacterium sp.]